MIMITGYLGVIELNTLLLPPRAFAAHTSVCGRRCGINPRRGFDSGVDNTAF